MWKFSSFLFLIALVDASHVMQRRRPYLYRNKAQPKLLYQSQKKQKTYPPVSRVAPWSPSQIIWVNQKISNSDDLNRR